MRGVVLPILASIAFLGLALQPATPPRDSDPHATPAPGAPVGPGCDLVVAYAEGLFGLLSSHEPYFDYFVSGDRNKIQAQGREANEEIVEEGRALLEEMAQLEPPGAYRAGHEGIRLLFDYDVDMVHFMGIDATDAPAPDQEQRDRSFALLLEGELMVAKACPDEIEEIGGQVFLPVETLEEIVGQGRRGIAGG